ncbi:MAG: hypothetical protein AB7M05_08645 [Alphaproteobacteria bacterium]
MKKRIEHIYATTITEVSEITLTIDHLTGRIQFGEDVANIYSELSYSRAKGPKILSRIPQGATVTFNASEALEKHYDFLCAVDTNTRLILGKSVSVVGVVTLQSVYLPEAKGLKKYWQLNVPFCLEYVEIKGSPENFGWMAAYEVLKKRGFLNEKKNVGVIVDSDLGRIADFNNRQKPVDEQEYLPQGITLIYASGDSGKEQISNRALSTADSAATQCLRAIEAGIVPFNPKIVEGRRFERYRLITPNVDKI